MWAALERGVTVDVGHGSHFSFEMARRTIEAGIRPHTLGADMHGYNVRVTGVGDAAARQDNPFVGVAPFNLTHAMTELLTLGMSAAGGDRDGHQQSRAHGADAGSVSARCCPDARPTFRCSDLLRGRFTLSDNSGEKVIAQQMLTPAFAIRAGRDVAADSPLIPPAALLAA